MSINLWYNYSMNNVIEIGGITKLDIDPDKVLKNAIGELEGVVIVGYDKDGEEYFCSSYADGGTALWLIKRLEMQLLSSEDPD